MPSNTTNNTDVLFRHIRNVSSSLLWSYHGGEILVGGVPTNVADGQITLGASATNYVEVDSTGVVSSNTTGATPGKLLLYTVPTDSVTILDFVDNRTTVALSSFFFQYSAVAIGDANKTLTQAQNLCDTIEVTGAQTAVRNVVVSVNRQRFLAVNSTTGGFGVLVKTASGSGVTVPPGTRWLVEVDGTNVTRVGDPSTAPFKLAPYTLATLPAAATYTNHLIIVTDATGGAKVCVSDGSNWKLLNTTTTVS